MCSQHVPFKIVVFPQNERVKLFSADHYDVKMPCHLILSKLADKCPSAVLAGLL
jgi:hypothetical protein